MRLVNLSQEYGGKPAPTGCKGGFFGVEPQEEGGFVRLVTLSQEYGVGRGRVYEIGTLIPRFSGGNPPLQDLKVVFWG